MQKALIRYLAVLALSLFGTVTSANAQQAGDAYLLNPGDQLAVSFPLNPELDSTGAIGPDGQFTVPLLGRVELSGLSLDQAEARLNAALREGRIVENANASISVGAYAGVVYVGGEVASPGAVPVIGALNPLQAIIQAGGLRSTARSRKIAVIRPAAAGPAQVHEVNLREFIKEGSAQAALTLRPGDIIFVPRSGIAEVNLWLDQHINGIIPDAFNLNYNLGNNASVNASDASR